MNFDLLSQGEDIVCIFLPTSCPQLEWTNAYHRGLHGLGMVPQSHRTRIHQGLLAELTVGIVVAVASQAAQRQKFIGINASLHGGGGAP